MRGRPWLLGLPILVVLVLAGLQLRSISRLRDADEAQLRKVAQDGADGVSWDFNHELARAYDWFSTDTATLHGDAWDQFSYEYDDWVKKAPQPRLFRAWYLVTDDGADGLSLRRYDPAARRFVAADWPPELTPLSTTIARENHERLATTAPLDFHAALDPEVADPPAMLVPLCFGPAAAGTFGRDPAQPAYGYEIGLLDMAYVEHELLPFLVRDNLSEGKHLRYDVEITRQHGDAAPLLALGPPPPAHADVESPLFRIGFAHLDDMFGDTDEDGFDRGLWRLRASYQGGGIAAHVARQKRADIALTAAVVALLLASLALVLAAARRARRLASQQLTFVAGITHELRTPLAVIRSAAENLADGVIGDPERVQRYGRLLVGEGRRLSHMVEQAIDFAALEAGARQAPEELYDVAELVAELCEARHADVVTRITSPLPALRGDPAATRMVLGNLVENARKHAPGAPIAIHVDAVEWLAGPGVRIEVIDRGAGIHPDDVPHLFEPFYRGKHAREKSVPGSGLGLSVVKRLIEQQHGTILVRSQLGSGSSFIVHLPGGQ
jgi:signal transduction histidine kinase